MFSNSYRLTILLSTSLVHFACMASPSPLAPQLKGSVGVPHNGVLTQGEELPKAGKGYERFRPEGRAYFGLPRLVRAIKNSAADVDESHPGGAPLVVGDLSAKTGGKIVRHNSHRTGRDVDLLFYVTTPQGITRTNPGFYNIEADGLVEFPDGSFGVLDLPRTWALVRSLITSDEVEIQFLFMRRLIEARLIEYALAKEQDLLVLWQAQTVMLQPGDSLPHADHIHMRISCSEVEMLSGCEGGGPRWPWQTPLPSLPDQLSTQVVAQLALEEEKERSGQRETLKGSALNDTHQARPSSNLGSL